MSHKYSSLNFLQVFEGITAVLFLVAASDFDQTLREDISKNRLEEAFEVFENVYKSRFIRDAGLIVFLNKQDLLKKKIDQGKRIGKYFPDYIEYQMLEKVDANDEYTRTKLFMKKKITVRRLKSENVIVIYTFVAGYS